jgi:hypothetical protein
MVPSNVPLMVVEPLVGSIWVISRRKSSVSENPSSDGVPSEYETVKKPKSSPDEGGGTTAGKTVLLAPVNETVTICPSSDVAVVEAESVESNVPEVLYVTEMAAFAVVVAPMTATPVKRAKAPRLFRALDDIVCSPDPVNGC